MTPQQNLFTWIRDQYPNLTETECLQKIEHLVKQDTLEKLDAPVEVASKSPERIKGSNVGEILGFSNPIQEEPSWVEEAFKKSWETGERRWYKYDGEKFIPCSEEPEKLEPKLPESYEIEKSVRIYRKKEDGEYYKVIELEEPNAIGSSISWTHDDFVPPVTSEYTYKQMVDRGIREPQKQFYPGDAVQILRNIDDNGYEWENASNVVGMVGIFTGCDDNGFPEIKIGDGLYGVGLECLQLLEKRQLSSGDKVRVTKHIDEDGYEWTSMEHNIGKIYRFSNISYDNVAEILLDGCPYAFVISADCLELVE